MSDNEGREISRNWTFWYAGAAAIVLALLYLFFFYPERNVGARQPIFFSHRVHAGVKQINCRFCHPYVSYSEHAGLPTMEKCFYCHKYVIPTHPQIVKEKEHYDQKKPVPWVRIYYVPDFVKFKHEPHIRWANLDCTQCHGDVASMDRLYPVNFEMGFCIGCHRERNAQTDCWLACHH